MFHPIICLDIINRTTPKNITQIESYAIAYTCCIWLEFRQERALERFMRCTKGTDAYADREATYKHLSDMKFAADTKLAEFVHWANCDSPIKRHLRCAEQRHIREIIYRHWDETTGKFWWEGVIYSL